MLSYPMNSMDGQKMKAKLLPPADPARKYGLHGLGLVNTLALPVATDDLAITIEPHQLVRCIRYYQCKLQGELYSNGLKSHYYMHG